MLPTETTSGLPFLHSGYSRCRTTPRSPLATQKSNPPECLQVFLSGDDCSQRMLRLTYLLKLPAMTGSMEANRAATLAPSMLLSAHALYARECVGDNRAHTARTMRFPSALSPTPNRLGCAEDAVEALSPRMIYRFRLREHVS